jgi:structural maintenance of chromosome 1
MIETISGSIELAQQYDEAKEGKERAEENTLYNYQKKKVCQMLNMKKRFKLSFRVSMLKRNSSKHKKKKQNDIKNWHRKR